MYDRGADGGAWVRSAPFAVCDPSDLGVSLAAGLQPGAEIVVISEDAALVGDVSDRVLCARWRRSIRPGWCSGRRLSTSRVTVPRAGG